MAGQHHRAIFLFNDIISAGYEITRGIVEKHCITVPKLYLMSWDYLKKLSRLSQDELMDYIKFELMREREIYGSKY